MGKNGSFFLAEPKNTCYAIFRKAQIGKPPKKRGELPYIFGKSACMSNDN